MRDYPDWINEKYELLECMSQSENGDTILALDRSSGQFVVVKTYYKNSPLFDANIPNEIKKLHCQGIPDFVDEYKDEDIRIEIREYIQGDTLISNVHLGKYSEEDTRSILLQLCDILSVLHNHEPQIIHRDIKPQNIIIDKDGNISLIDFGIARTVEDTEDPNDSMDTVVMGTREFAPPEQYGFMHTDARSDIYSLGVLIRWMSNTSTFDKIIEKCTAFDPKNRYRKIEDVARDIKKTKKTDKRKIISILAGILAIALIACIILDPFTKSISFKEPLIERAIRTSLGVSDRHKITQADLEGIENIFIVADRTFEKEEDFYNAINEWYEKDRSSWGPIKSIEDVSKCPNLKRLCIVAQNISDLSPIKDMVSIEKIEIKHNNVSDISSVSSLTNLGSLGLCENPVTDITPAIACKNLRYLDLNGVDRYDPEPIAEFNEFIYLDIANATTSYRYLENTVVHELHLQYLNVPDFDFLLHIPGLEKVRLSRHNGNQIIELGDVPFEKEYE